MINALVSKAKVMQTTMVVFIKRSRHLGRALEGVGGEKKTWPEQRRVWPIGSRFVNVKDDVKGSMTVSWKVAEKPTRDGIEKAESPQT